MKETRKQKRERRAYIVLEEVRKQLGSMGAIYDNVTLFIKYQKYHEVRLKKQKTI